MVKIILVKFPNEWATTKQVCKDELVVYLSFSSHNIYIALLLCIEHCFTYVKILLFKYIYIYIYIYIINWTNLCWKLKYILKGMLIGTVYN